MTRCANFTYGPPGGPAAVRPKSGTNAVLQWVRGVLQRYWGNFIGPALPVQNER